MPPNLQEVKLKFSRRISAKVMGSLAQGKEEPQEGTSVKGILVSQNFQSKIVAPEDLQNYTQLRVGFVSSKIHVPFAGQVETLRLFLNEMFSGVTEEERYDSLDGDAVVTTFAIQSSQLKIVLGEKRGIASVEWTANPVADLLADSVIALLMHSQSSAASIRLTSKPCRHRSIKTEDPPSKKAKSVHQSFLEDLSKMLSNHNQFEAVQANISENSATFELQTEMLLNAESGQSESLKCEVQIHLDTDREMNMKVRVSCEDEKLARSIRDCIRCFADAASPIIVL